MLPGSEEAKKPKPQEAGLRLRGACTRLPFTRADAYGAILEAATAHGASFKSEASFEFYEFVSRAQVLRSSGQEPMANLAATLLEVVDEIVLLRVNEPLTTAWLPPRTGGFLLAMELVMVADRGHLVERINQTLRVPQTLAGKIVTVLSRPDWR